MLTAVQLSFPFDIASMQLTPSFKMGALQLRPRSKIVTMRLASEQQPHEAMAFQVTFEIAKIQPAGGGLGTVRLLPSRQQASQIVGSPSLTVAGLQLVPNFQVAPVQLTPSQQLGVVVTAGFQIAMVEFSPSFEIASVVLNSTSKQVAVQLAGTGTIETAPMFEIANLQLGPSGEIALVQVNMLGAQPVRVQPPRPQPAVRPPEPVRVWAKLSTDSDLSPFRDALRNQRDLLPATARRIRIDFELPHLRSFDDFDERIAANSLESRPVDITEWLSPEANPDYIAFYALYPSRHVRAITVHAVRRQGRIWATFPDLIAFLDPAAPLEEWELAGHKGKFDLLPVELPTRDDEAS